MDLEILNDILKAQTGLKTMMVSTKPDLQRAEFMNQINYSYHDVLRPFMNIAKTIDTLFESDAFEQLIIDLRNSSHKAHASTLAKMKQDVLVRLRSRKLV